ncbi:tRNA uridine 5-carboxymethylaminomethyl modification enzyme MnmG [Zea mays]|uniref:Glucose-inhibited division family A protein n=2 Tax=Zea mays TaxID=4577 RepID=A0A1D6MTK7_MAIZE|nr:glucose-inhibited division family A protein [Zea mays]PWZ04716.1 tRNA uridine 5-carboxymethylaminomethyl modification enzyme MnmG [Zea mays]
MPDARPPLLRLASARAPCFLRSTLTGFRGSIRSVVLLQLIFCPTQPCNPAVGGPATSQLVHEVDALGGKIGKITDRCYLQKRVLNSSKGPAICALRAQPDKREYAIEMKNSVESTENLFIREAMATEVLIGKNDTIEVSGAKLLGSWGVDLPIRPLHTLHLYWRVKPGQEQTVSTSAGFPTFSSYGDPPVYGAPSLELPGLIKISCIRS